MSEIATLQAVWDPPDQFEEYRLVRRVGHGGMGDVYLAHDALLDRFAAVKFIRAVNPDPIARERFLVEARAAARVQHPNVVTVHRVGELDGRPYLIAEYVQGKSLADLETPMPWRRVVDLGVGLARGLAAAHRQGILHRDIKPANAILADDGLVKLVDFGLAKMIDMRGPAVPPPPTAAPPKPKAEGNQGTDETLELALPLAAADSAPLSGRLRQLTAAGTVLGTPDYMAPELWFGDAASVQSDVYAFGALLYYLCAGEPPFGRATLAELSRLATQTRPRPLGEVAADVDGRLIAIVERCLRREPLERFRTADELRDALEVLVPAAHDRAIPEGNPYRGLRAFEAEHRALFCGRGVEIRAVVDLLRARSVVLVAGDSGVGKSSLCRAGVVPLVGDGILGDGRDWRTLVVEPGPRPIRALAAALATALQTDEESLERELATSPGDVARRLRRALRDGRGTLIFIDQLEELVTVSDAAQAALAGNAIAELSAGVPGVRILLTARTDFLTRLAAFSGLADVLARSTYLLPPLSRDGIREAVTGPARVKGVAFESDALVDELIASARAGAALPLLQFALAELWDARDAGGAITAAALAAIGGVSGALARHGDAVLRTLPESSRISARRMLVAMVTAEKTRARRSEAELAGADADARRALDVLVRGRLVLAREESGGTVYELAHDALITGWSTLRDWIDELAGSRIVRHRLETAAAEWERLAHPPEVLWSARQLRELAPVALADLGERERRFVAASRGAARRRVLMRWAAAAAVILGIAGIVVGIAITRQRMTTAARRTQNLAVSRDVDEARALLDRAAEVGARAEDVRRRALAAYDAGDRGGGDALWPGVLELDEQQDLLLAQASTGFETALRRDGGRRDVRNMLSAVLYQRVLIADRARRSGQRDELLQRLAVYDEADTYRRQWTAPGHVTIGTAAPATAHLARYDRGPNGRRVLAEARSLGTTPLVDVALAPGAYRVTLAAAGRATVQYPLVIEAGARMAIDVALPDAAAVPAGFVYIPAGEFLLGSADDHLRRFDFTAPMHRVHTGHYYIGRHEVTFRDWLAFLDALPAARRAAHTPRVEAGGFQGSLTLRPRPAGWELSFQPGDRPYRALAGEKIQYARTVRAEQDWLAMPVIGISAKDAEAYAAWLAETGRVPGARLCTEIEWERAARGADDRAFPHGDELERDDANRDATYGRQPSAIGPDEVGSFPASESPFGLHDAAGNAFEWTRSAYKEENSTHVPRGGAYLYDDHSCRVTNRQLVHPDFRDLNVGMRVCATP